MGKRANRPIEGEGSVVVGVEACDSFVLRLHLSDGQVVTLPTTGGNSPRGKAGLRYDGDRVAADH